MQLDYIAYTSALGWRPVIQAVCQAFPKARVKVIEFGACPSSYKMGHQTGLSLGGSGSSLGLIMHPAFDVASGDIGLSVS